MALVQLLEELRQVDLHQFAPVIEARKRLYFRQYGSPAGLELGVR